MEYHVPVLLEPVIGGLNLKANGIYVDATFGGGGHTKAILEKIADGKVIGIDQDEDAAKEAGKIRDRAFEFIPGNFRFITRYLNAAGIKKVGGILADLGVSSHQFDVPERGFSIRSDSELDMRMDKSSGITARSVLNNYKEAELTGIFSKYGEIGNAKKLASVIVSARINQPLRKTTDLLNVIRKFAPGNHTNKFFAKVFQALRIEVNDEMNSLREFLVQCPDLLSRGGRMAVISYHSLEDRMVKNLMLRGNIEGKVEKDIYGNPANPFRPLTRRPIAADHQEISKNSRARSAKLRIAEKL
ncbi:MAG TPA: 16S rRNA (cytosine(1402)-N(4))-methyltransferase RsmH [Cyclobacteriaceae bacterium]|nr:16S rRNA (cytosine(1402)-N(4))-methyltransferase RsmH [Cyclobacteriaceae bacterium]